MAFIKHRYNVGKGIVENREDSLTKSINALVLKNFVFDVKLGAYVPRKGSVTQTISGTLGVPLSMGFYSAVSSGSFMAEDITPLVNFGGTAFRAYDGGSWSTITKDSNTDFHITKQGQSCQLGNYLYLAGGRPAYWDGSSLSNNIYRIGCPAPTSTITHTTSATGITGNFKYMYTYYNPTTGIESDWSPLSTTASPSNNQVNLTIPTTAASANGFTQVKIYRTLSDGGTYYLLTTQLLSVGSYTDTTTDATLRDNTSSAKNGEYSLPPTESFICEAFNSRVFMVDADNPKALRWSKPYQGSDIDLQYWPDKNVKYFDKPITGLISTPNRMFIAHPNGWSYFAGFSEEDFISLPQLNGAGTSFPNSICTDGKRISYLGQSGFEVIDEGGKRLISRELDESFKSLLNYQYTDSLYIKADYHPTLRQFIFCFSAINTNSTPWVDSNSGVIEEWEDADTGITEEWEAPGVSGGAESRTRVKIFAWSPDLSSGEDNEWTEYELSQVSDLNDEGAYLTGIWVPPVDAEELNPFQDSAYFLHYDGTEGKVISCFERDRTKDDDLDINTTFISGRIKPGQEDSTLSYCYALSVVGSYADPFTTGTVTYIKNFDEPHLRDYTSNERDFSDLGDMKLFQDPVFHHFHLKVMDSDIIPSFYLHFRPRKETYTR